MHDTFDASHPTAGWFGRLQRNGWLLAAMGAAFFLGAPITRLLASYRGVVLAVQDDKMYMAYEDRPPHWVDAQNVESGSIVEKERGAWNAQEVEPKARDLRLKQLYERYNATYEAVIVRIDPPLGPGQAAVAVIDTAGQKRLRVPLFAESLAGAAVGRRLRKEAHAWDPLLLDDDSRAGKP